MPRVLHKLAVMGFAVSQIAAACAYSPPPMISHGQGADTVGVRSMQVGGELGFGTTASWWNSASVADPEVSDGWLGGARLRLGVSKDLDAGLVAGVGPERAVIVGPELKWRFAHLRAEHLEEGPSFHAALVSGVGLGSADYRYPRREGEPDPRYWFVAPYTGVLASGGTDQVQMFSGLRLAASETLGNEVRDLTLYPVLAFGALLHPTKSWTFWAEGDLASGITTHDTGDTAVIVYVGAGLTLTLEEVW